MTTEFQTTVTVTGTPALPTWKTSVIGTPVFQPCNQEMLHEMILWNLKAANEAEKNGREGEAKHYREHASRLTVIKFGL